MSILIETLRREGYELEVSQPKVIFKTVGDDILEPIEQVVIEVDPEFQGPVMQALGERKGEVTNITMSAVGTVRLEIVIATRALIGFRGEFLMMTRGTGIMYQNFYQYQKHKGEMPKRNTGVMVSMNSGRAVAFALWGLQDRGEVFVHPGDELSEGMIIGANNKGSDMVVNAIKEKKQTNIRAAGSDDAIQLVPPREMTLEFALVFVEGDELIEVTPKNIRLRKLHLDFHDRKRAAKRVMGG
jgi:GTP-binding protein